MRPRYKEFTINGIIKQEVKDNKFCVKHQIIQVDADQNILLYFYDSVRFKSKNKLKAFPFLVPLANKFSLSKPQK